MSTATADLDTRLEDARRALFHALADLHLAPPAPSIYVYPANHETALDRTGATIRVFVDKDRSGRGPRAVLAEWAKAMAAVGTVYGPPEVTDWHTASSTGGTGYRWDAEIFGHLGGALVNVHLTSAIDPNHRDDQ